jgi:transcriptional regulator with XRE-family HTH domain
VQEVTVEELDWQLWVVNAVGELLTTASSLSVPPLKEGIAAAVKMCVDKLAGGNMSALERKLQIPAMLIRRWKNGQSLPCITTLLQLCYRLNVPPFRFLTGPIEDFADSLDGAAQLFTTEPHKGRNLDRDEIKRALEAVLEDRTRPFPPLNEVARRLDRKPSVLQKHFPDLCRSIVEQYKNQFSSNDLRNALEAIIAANENPPPTLNEVGRRLGYKPNVLCLNFPDLCCTIVAQHRERFNAQKVQHELEEIVKSDETPFPSMCEVARRLGYSEKIIRLHFPVLCKQISARYLAYWEQSAQARKERIRDEVRKAVRDLHSQGKYPNSHLVASLLTKPHNILEQETVKAWHEALQELGLAT